MRRLANAQQIKLNANPTEVPMAIFNALPNSKGATKPATNENTIVCINDCSEAAKPAVFGNISNPSRVTFGMISASPKVYNISGKTAHGTAATKNTLYATFHAAAMIIKP